MPDDDEIRLTVPADAQLEAVVVAAVAAVVRRTGMGEAEVTEARRDAAAGFAKVLEVGIGDVTLTAEGGRRLYRFELRREGSPTYKREAG